MSVDILDLVIASFDQLVSHPLKCDGTGPPAAITLRRYRRVWRRYLAWMDILGLRLDQYEREHVTRIWGTLQAYLAHPAETLAVGRFLQRMEETASRRQAVKRVYNRNYQ
ncbi:hypothetical protein BBP40_010064 [Aspergillus hancockii]|nr:hypothetical protein BBP40_010064 [Aspergillus hancockii]